MKDTTYKVTDLWNGAIKPTHLQLFERLRDTEPSTVPVTRCLLILSTPRCGSTLFSEALNSCGRLGICEEWFNYEYFAAWAKVMGVKEVCLSKYLKWIEERTTRDTGTWCLKMHIGQLLSMNEKFQMNMESMSFDSIVYLYRRDKIAQAVSMVKAVVTDSFRSTEEELNDCVITRPAVAEAIHTLTKADMFARNYLRQFISELYAYEDFKDLDTPQQRAHPCYADALRAMEVDPTGASFRCDLKRQADHRNMKAIKDFRDYLLGDK